MNKGDSLPYLLVIGAIGLFAISKILVSDVPELEWGINLSLIPFIFGVFLLWRVKRKIPASGINEQKDKTVTMPANLLVTLSIISAIVVSLGLDFSKEAEGSFISISIFTVPFACVLLIVGRIQLTTLTKVTSGLLKFFLIWVLCTLGIFFGTKTSMWVVFGIAFQTATALLFWVVYKILLRKQPI